MTRDLYEHTLHAANRLDAFFPPLDWLAEYQSSWLRHDAIAGVTLGWLPAISRHPPISIWRGARMLLDLHDQLMTRQVAFCIVGAHAQLRDLLRAEGLAEWLRTLDSVLGDEGRGLIRLRAERPTEA